MFIQEYGGYIADITRTWPVNGKFTEAQKDLYEAILKVQRTCISLCRQRANVSLDKLHEIAENGLKEQLKQLGFDVSGTVWPKAHSSWPSKAYSLAGDGDFVPTSPRPLHWT